jgi:hypothetical protein
MSLGGYMFEGRFCQKGSLTDVQWYHLLHATRVAAFMAANTRANAGWEYDMTGSSDGNIHCLDAVGNNYVTCFKNTAKGTYFALYTLCKATGTGTDSGSVQVTMKENYWRGSSNLHYLGVGCSCFYTISKSHIAYDAKPGNVGCGLIPVGNTGTDSDLGSNYTTVSSTFAGLTNARFGFAIKGDDIIAIQSKTSSTYLSVISGSGFSSFVNANDTQGIYCLNAQSIYTSSAYDVESDGRNSANLSMPVCICQNYLGNFYFMSNLGFTPLTRYFGNMQEYPFESLYVYGITNSQTNVSGKGTLKVDLMSMNCPGANNGIVPGIWSTVAGGNYLTIRSLSGSNYYTFNKVNGTSDIANNVAIYCGWDASNPDITQESAWTEYTES